MHYMDAQFFAPQVLSDYHQEAQKDTPDTSDANFMADKIV